MTPSPWASSEPVDRVRVTATPAALEVITRLEAAHGPLVFFQSGGCCEGTAPMCLSEGELAAGPRDRYLGSLAGQPFFIDSDQDDRWGRPTFVVDIRPGAAEGFSLEGLGEDVHFVTRTVSSSSAGL